MRKLIIVLLAVGFMLWADVSQTADKTVIRDGVSFTIEVSGTESQSIAFPARNVNPEFNGFVSVAFYVTEGAGAAITLTVYVKSRVLDSSGNWYINQADSIILVSELDFSNELVYVYPIEEPFGPSHGLEIYFKYSGGGEPDRFQGLPWLICN